MLGRIEYLSDAYIKNIMEADVFLHPSQADKKGNKEGIPTSITEAMAAGLPVISTFHAGIPSVVKENFNGILVEENNYEAIADAITKIVSNSKIREIYSINAHDYARRNLNIKNTMVKLESIYDQLIQD